MTLFWNLKLGRLVTDVGGEVERSAINFKRGDAAEIEILFFRGNVVQVMPTTMEIRFAVKPTNSFSSPPLVFQNAFTRQNWTNPATQEVVVGGRWLADISTNTEQINDYFADEGEPDSVELRGEITYRADDDRGWNSSQTFSVGIDNDLIKGDEGTPTNAEEPTNYITTTGAEARYVRYDASQTLTGGQKTQARTNIGALEGTGLGVSTSEQTLTSEQKAQVLTNLGLSSASDAQIFTTPGSYDWNSPTTTVRRAFRLIMVGGGGGGGSGRKGDAASGAGGGGGGSPGSVVIFDGITGTGVNAILTVVVGAGGAGGAQRSTDSSSGLAGSNGGDSSVSGPLLALTAKGGLGGAGGTSTTAAAGAARTASTLIGGQLLNTTAGGAGSSFAGGVAPSSAVPLTTGGGGGGGVSSGGLSAGGAGGGVGNSLIGLIAGAAGGTTEGAPGEPGPVVGVNGLGGGGGHAASTGQIAGNGGAGGGFGGGGGGGGGVDNGTDGFSGAGGAGGNGLVIIAVF
jgi:hypothetical protein